MLGVGFPVLGAAKITPKGMSAVHLAHQPSPQPSPKQESPEEASKPKPFYLPLDEIIPVEEQNKIERKRTQKSIQTSEGLGSDRTVDFSQFNTGIINQYRGDCTAQAMAGGMENKLRQSVDTSADVSQESLWAWYRQPSVYAAVNTAQKTWVKRESAWPFGARSFKLPEERGLYRADQIEYLGDYYTPGIKQKIIASLDQRNPVYWGGSVNQDMASCFVNIRANVPQTNGGHSVPFTGYKVSKGVLWTKLKQSWGKNCGDGGYQWFNIDSCANGYCLFWSVKKVSMRGEAK